MVSDNTTLNKVYTAENHKELMDAYKDWAKDYDSDTVDSFGYVAHIATGNALNSLTEEKDITILDAGCGTGLVGEVLKTMGYKSIDALDYSKEMLDEAGTKDVYDDLIHADLSKPLEIGDNAYDAVVCAGTFTYGHVGAEAFDELIRITRPGGYICFTIRDGAYEDYGYRKRMIDLEKEKAWELVEMRKEHYLKNEGVTCKLCAYKVTAPQSNS